MAQQQQFVDRDAAHLVHPLHNPAAHASARVWAGGEGAYLVDVDGNRFIDCLSGLWNNTAGNGRHELADAASKQMREMGFAGPRPGGRPPRSRRERRTRWADRSVRRPRR